MCTSATPASAGPPGKVEGPTLPCTTTSEGQNPFSPSQDPGTSRSQGEGAGHLSLIHATAWQMKRNTISSPALLPSWLAHLHSSQENQLCCACSLGEVQCQFCHSHDLKARSPIHRRLRGGRKLERGLLFLAHSTAWQMRMEPDLRYFHGGRSPVPLSIRSALLCSQGEIQGPLF